MHILKIIHGYPPLYNAGSEVYSQSLVNELARQGHRVSIFTREENAYLPDYQMRREALTEKITKYVVNMPRAKDRYRHEAVDKALARLIDEIKPDIAHIGHLNHLSTGIVEVLKEAGLPVVFTLHDFWLMCPRGQFIYNGITESEPYALCQKQEDKKCAVRCYNRYFSGQDKDRERDIAYWTNWINTRMQETRRVAELTDLFIAPSRYLMRRFVEEFGVPREKILYLDYGFPLHYLRPVKPKQGGVFTFGYIGTHIPAKGVNLLIEAFKKLKVKARLKIWGRPRPQSTEYLKMISQGYDVEFCGEYVNQNLADVVFSKIDAIVVPSIWGENSPLVIHEAQACHIPVITADYGGMAEYVRHLENGLLFKHRSAEDLTRQMQFAAENPELMQRLGKRGYLYSSDGRVPDIEGHTHKIVRIYQTLKNGQDVRAILYEQTAENNF